ncbi:MAG: hypothetical protein ABIH28_02855 [archaeon]
MNKKAQGLSINAIILIVLGLAVLVILILGFMLGWNRIIPWLGDKNNVDTIAKSCETACGSENAYNYCSVGRELSDGKVTFAGVTCYTLVSLPETFSKYGIKACTNIACKPMVKCAEWKYIGADGKPVDLISKTDYCS